MTLQSAHFCEFLRVLTDGKIDLFGTFDVYNSLTVPVVFPMFIIFVKFREDEAERAAWTSRPVGFTGKTVHLTITLVSPSGKVLFRTNLEHQSRVDYPEIPPRVQAASVCQNVEFTEFGFHQMIITVDGIEFLGPALLIRRPTGEEIGARHLQGS